MSIGSIFCSNTISKTDTFIEMVSKKSKNHSISIKTAEHLLRALNADYGMSKGLATLVVLDKHKSNKNLEQLSKEGHVLNSEEAGIVLRMMDNLKEVRGDFIKGVERRCERLLGDYEADVANTVGFNSVIQEKTIPQIESKLVARNFGGVGEKQPEAGAAKKVTLNHVVPEIIIPQIDRKLDVRSFSGVGEKRPEAGGAKKVRFNDVRRVRIFQPGDIKIAAHNFPGVGEKPPLKSVLKTNQHVSNNLAQTAINNEAKTSRL